MLRVRDLTVSFGSRSTLVKAVSNLTFDVQKGTCLGIVGESGCGKTVTCRSILQLNRDAKYSGEISFNNDNILTMPEKEINKLRGNKISMIFQSPSSSLNPLLTIGEQITEVIQYHQNSSYDDAVEQAVDLLRSLNIFSPREKMKEYPYQQSGGINQRIMIAIALSCNPDLLIADEPTSALDVTVQSQILQMFSKLKENMGIIFVTHDLGVLSQIADQVLVMYKGWLMESGDVNTIIRNPKHPYTKQLIASVPLLGNASRSIDESPCEHLRNGSSTGCPYLSQCKEVIGDECQNALPDVHGKSHQIRCHRFVQE